MYSVEVLNYINDLKIIFKRLKQGRIVKRSRRKRIKISDWPTKKKLRSFQKKREQRTAFYKTKRAKPFHRFPNKYFFSFCTT
jgi:hypothetical protein